MTQNLFRRAVCFICLLTFLLLNSSAFCGLIYVVQVRDLVERVLVSYLVRAVSEAEAAGADLIIFEIETPGGFVSSTYKIIDPIIQTTIPTVTWIHNDAISAGSLIALACDDIIMSDGGTFGAAVPYSIKMDQEKKQISLEVDKKFQSVFLKQYLSAADANGHDLKLARAMVTSDHDDITYEDYEIEPPADIKPGRRPVELGEGEKRPWILALGRAKQDEADKSKHFLCQRGEVLTLSTSEAESFGMTTATCNSIPQILALEKFAHLQKSQVVNIDRNWSEAVARFLSSPLMTIVLIVGTIMGISTELKMPGFGFPGILGISCLALLFFSRLGVGAAEWTDLIILIIGLVLLAIELFVIPGFGFVGFAGIVLIFTGIFLMLYNPEGGLLPLEGLYSALWQMVIGMGVAVVGLFFVYKFITPSTPMLGKLILGETEDSSADYSADRTIGESEEDIVGKIGRAKSKLRPSGKAVFDDRLYDVVTQGDVVESGDAIRIIEIKGNRIVVEKTDEGTA